MYFVTSDIHSYYTIFKEALANAGFDIKNPEHKLIICGDLFDRGLEAKELLKFLLSIPKDRLILVKGNHEDLFEECLEQLKCRVNISQYHWSNGTLDTIGQLVGVNKYDLACGVYNYEKDIIPKLKNYYKLIKRAVDYYELGDYIFVHGWIPHVKQSEDLANCNEDSWKAARWENGIYDWHHGWKLDGKTIVCGHWHCSWGWSYLRNKYKEFPQKNAKNFSKSFEPFIDDGIIALDACTAYSGICNVYCIK